MTTIRTRFAPSPTGFMHVGSVRTALFAWLLARQADEGKFIIRIEDTDKTREVEGSIAHIHKSLEWMGILWDEGVEIGGPFAPYLQSERLETYKKWAQVLIDKGLAYADPYSQAEIDVFREQAKAEKRPFLYRHHRPQQPSIWDGTQPLRFKSNPKRYTWEDAVMGELSAGEEAIDDFILIKSDGYPTYNFCHIIDDMLMEVTHVLRSQEFISSTPKFLNLYEALEIKQPVLATLPFVMAIDGKKKLGKRDGAKDILKYADDGILPEAMMNFLATLGWNDGTEQEVFTQQELIQKFDLSRVQKSPARFDESRLLWLNGQHIRALSVDELMLRSQDFWSASAKKSDPEYRRKVLTIVQDRLKTLQDIPLATDYFFEAQAPAPEMITENKQLKKLSSSEITEMLERVFAAFSALSAEEWNAKNLQYTLNKLLEITSQKPGVLFSLTRIAVTWAPFSPQLNDTLEVLGREVTLSRLESAISIQK